MGPKDKTLTLKYCKWCGKKTSMGSMLTSETPILEFLEDKINEHGREKIWGEYGDWSEEILDSEFEAELLVYDSMLNNVTKKIICISCLKQDDDLFNKYYNNVVDGIDDEDIDDYIIELT